MQSEIDRNLASGGQHSHKRLVIKDLEKKFTRTNEEIVQMEKDQGLNQEKIS